MAKLVDAHDLGSCGATLGGSSPLIRTKNRHTLFTPTRLAAVLPGLKSACLFWKKGGSAAEKTQQTSLPDHLAYTQRI